MEKHPNAAMLYGRTQFWFSWLPDNSCRAQFFLAHDDPDPMTITSVKFDQLIEPPAQLLLYLHDRNIYPCSCSILVRRSVFHEIGLFEEQFKNAHEDMVFHSKVFLKYQENVSSKCWDRYRIHPDSYWRTAWLAGKGRETSRQGRFNYLTWLKRYLTEKDITDPQIWKKLNLAFIPFRYPKLFRLVEILYHPFFLAKVRFKRLKNRCFKSYINN